MKIEKTKVVEISIHIEQEDVENDTYLILEDEDLDRLLTKKERKMPIRFRYSIENGG